MLPQDLLKDLSSLPIAEQERLIAAATARLRVTPPKSSARPKAAPPYKTFGEKYRDDPAAFARDCIRWDLVGAEAKAGRRLAPYQEEILGNVVKFGRESVRGPHGLGKSTINAILVLWFGLTRDALELDWKVPTTASAWRQLERYLWPEIRKWAAYIDWTKVGRGPFRDDYELGILTLKLKYGSAFALTSNKPALIEGAHASQILFVFDESKRLDVATPIPTPEGWTTMGALKVGDRVLDEEGRPCNVTYVSPVVGDRPCAKITFEDGSEIVADEGHLWAALPYARRQNWGNFARYRKKVGREHEGTTDWREYWDRAEILETKDLLPLPQGSAIPTCRPLNLPEADLPIDPYVLGAWLGDGFSHHGAIESADEEVIARIRGAGYEVRERHRASASATYGIIGLQPQLRALGVLLNKHIPEIYLRASFDQRLALLQGLMDTDGCVMGAGKDSRVAIGLTNERLALGVAELARTFGWKVRPRTYPTNLGGKPCRPVTIMRWSADICPFTLPRKAERWLPRAAQASSSTIRTIRSIEPVESVPTRCIAVDSPRHLYLAGEDFVPTHNTIPGEMFDAAEGALGTANPEFGTEVFAISTSTPGAPSGRFYDIQSKRKGFEDWHVRHVTRSEVIAAGLLNFEFAEARKRQWGAESPQYLNRIEGQFADSDAETVIPLSWVEAAVERWEERKAQGTLTSGGYTCTGADIASGGGDLTAFATRYGDVITGIQTYGKSNTMQTANRLKAVADRMHGGYLIVDAVGVGAGVFDRLRELRVRVRAFIGPRAAEGRDITGELGFANERSAAWWQLRERLDPSRDPKLCLPPSDELADQLSAPHYKEVRTNPPVYQIEPKEDLVERLGRSTDHADAVVMACFKPALSRGHTRVPQAVSNSRFGGRVA